MTQTGNTYISEEVKEAIKELGDTMAKMHKTLTKKHKFSRKEATEYISSGIAHGVVKRAINENIL